jgi:class 3 adenylate cyclase
VFDAMLEKAMRLCEAAYGHFVQYDGDLFHRVAVRGKPAIAEWQAQRGRSSRGEGTVTFQRLLEGETVIHVPDVMDTDAYRAGNLAARALVDIGGCRTLLTVALRKGDALAGLVSLYREGVRPFTDKQIALLQNFAAQAVIAMENARLITETREALEQQTATAEVLGVINSSPGDIKPVFDAILEKAHKLCGAAFGGLLTYDGEAFHVVATHNLPREFAELTSRPFRVGPDNPFSRLIRGERLVHIPDLAEMTAASPDDPMLRGAVELGGVRTILQMPLRRDDDFLGVITAYRQEVQPFTEQQIALLENFAAQAVIAMENARLITETREALEQQTATAEVLGVINSSPGDLVPVFDAMLEKAMRLCEADFGALCLFGSQGFRVAATRGFPATLNDFLRGELPVHPGSVPDRMRHGERVIHIPDLTIAEAAARTPVFNAMIDLGGARSTVWVDLRKDDRAAGFFAIYRQEVSPFTDKQIALLQNFAAQAVIAMENARLLGELRERNDEIAGWNKELEARVAAQLAEIERTGKLRRFLAPQLAELIVAQGDESILESHRREIVVVFCDVRGFTGFAERAEPEEVMAFLRDYHAALGPVVARFEGTLDHYSGDGIMVFFNDPLPTPEPAKRAIAMAVAMREAAQQILAAWRRHGHVVGFGAGISQGYATLGQIGFAERMDYTAIGTVCNLAARLCDEAKDGQILISRRVAVAVEDEVNLEEIGEVSLKGLSQPVAVYNVG